MLTLVRDRLAAELEAVDRPLARPQPLDLGAGAVEQRPAGADRGAHRLAAGGGAVVAHVALHHQVEIGLILGTPNGQASTQLLQAMQRGLRAVCTTPSSVFLMASAGQTSAQVGESQCMHTTGTVCVECGAIDVFQVDHRVPLVRVALAAGLDARLAADAAAGVDEELHGRSGTGIADGTLGLHG